MEQDHVHMLIEIPPKYAVSEKVGYLKGKNAIVVARQFSGRKRNFNGEALWARGYAVSTVGFEEVKNPQDFNIGSPWGCSQPSSLPLCGSVILVKLKNH